MHRIDTPTAQKDKFGQGKNGFTNGDPTTGTPSTGLDEAMFDALQEEVCTVIERSGIKLNKDQHDQLYKAIRKLSTEDLSKALLKAQNLADLPDKGAARSHLEVYSQSETDTKFLPKTGGTVNGDVIVEGNKLSLKGNDRKHFCIQDQDGSARMWLYKDKGGDGVHLNNGNDGGGDWLFHKNGNFHAPAGIFAGGNLVVSWGGRTATFHENGDVTGLIWGGALSAWLNNQLNSRTRTQVSGSRGGWWYKDESTGFIFQGGVVNRADYETRVNFSRNYQRECFGIQMTLGLINGHSGTNIEARYLDNNGFTAYMAPTENNAYWWAVGV